MPPATPEYSSCLSDNRSMLPSIRIVFSKFGSGGVREVESSDGKRGNLSEERLPMGECDFGPGEIPSRTESRRYLVCERLMEGFPQACILDNLVYVGFRDDGTQFPDVVSRDNCASGLYCDGPTLQVGCGRSYRVDRPCLLRLSRIYSCSAKTR